MWHTKVKNAFFSISVYKIKKEIWRDIAPYVLRNVFNLVSIERIVNKTYCSKTQFLVLFAFNQLISCDQIISFHAFLVAL